MKFVIVGRRGFFNGDRLGIVNYTIPCKPNVHGYQEILDDGGGGGSIHLAAHRKNGSVCAQYTVEAVLEELEHNFVTPVKRFHCRLAVRTYYLQLSTHGTNPGVGKMSREFVQTVRSECGIGIGKYQYVC